MKDELPYLTSLRGICALAVLAFHVNWLPMGDRGVDVFFLLSGYVLTWGHRRRPRGAMAFWRARLWRTMPTHLVATTAVGIAAVALGAGTLSQLAADLALFPILPSLPTPAINSPTWSLVVEWVAYLLFPLAVGAIVRRPLAALAGAALALLAASLTLRTQGWAPDIARGLTEFAIGAAVAALGWEPRAHRWLAWVDAAPLRWLGDISYPLYMIQALPLFLLCGGPNRDAGPLRHTAAAALTLGLAVALHLLVEVPARRRFGRAPVAIDPQPLFAASPAD